METCYTETETARLQSALLDSESQTFHSKKKLKVSQWAEKYRIVTEGHRQGNWSNKVTPYLVEPMDCWSQPWIRKIILCFAPQTGKTQAAFNSLCYSVDQDPGPAMYIMPDEKTAKRISRRRLIPMFKGTPRIAQLLGSASDASTLAVRFLNGMDLMLVWSTSAAELSSESVRYLFFDETDKYPRFAGNEADPLSLGEIRTNTFPHTKKILYLSTPTTIDGVITKAIKQEADEVRDYFVPCRICGYFQIMEFKNIHWPKDIRDPRYMLRKKSAKYGCTNCGMDWDDRDRVEAVAKGRWQPRKEADRPQAVAFHLPSWYSPFITFSVAAAAFLKGQEDRSKFMVFVTQHEAKPWNPTVQTQNERQILSHKTDISPGIVPSDAVAVTCGVDAQKHGFWFVVRAWAKDLTSWLIRYGFLASFYDLETLLFRTLYPMQGTDQKKRIWRAAIDTGGGVSSEGDWSRTEEIYVWLREHSDPYAPRGVFGVKGASRPQISKVQPRVIDKMPNKNRSIPGGLMIRILDTNQFKGIIHWRMTRQKGDTQRFYLHSETGIDYAKQILAEELRERGGKMKWHRRRRDNHLLDCEVYAAACASPEWAPSLSDILRYRAAEVERQAAQAARRASAPPEYRRW